MKTTAVCFPFDLFGSPGTGAGATLLADELREMLADNKRETVETRARAYTDQVRLRDVSFATTRELDGWRSRGRQLARQALRQNDFLLWLSGNHLGALPVYDELSALGESVLVVQFDAHLDIHHFRDCETELSHGNFLLHLDGPTPPLVNVGHRELLLTRPYIGEHYRRAFSALELALDEAAVLRELKQAAKKADRVLLDLDCDAFDPVHFPAVAQPVPVGLKPIQLLRVIEAIWSDKVGGLLVSEFWPAKDQEDRSLALLVWLIEWLLLRRYEAE